MAETFLYVNRILEEQAKRSTDTQKYMEKAVGSFGQLAKMGIYFGETGNLKISKSLDTKM